MVASRLIWFGYIIIHLWGNLKIYAGADILNGYGGFLRTVCASINGSWTSVMSNSAQRSR